MYCKTSTVQNSSDVFINLLKIVTNLPFQLTIMTSRVKKKMAITKIESTSSELELGFAQKELNSC